MIDGWHYTHAWKCGVPLDSGCVHPHMHGGQSNRADGDDATCDPSSGG